MSGTTNWVWQQFLPPRGKILLAARPTPAAKLHLQGGSWQNGDVYALAVGDFGEPTNDDVRRRLVSAVYPLTVAVLWFDFGDERDYWLDRMKNELRWNRE